MSENALFVARQPSIESLLKKIAKLEQRIEQLEQENATLLEKLAKYEIPKDSSNSSVPLCKDENRPSNNRSLREQSGKKPGG